MRYRKKPIIIEAEQFKPFDSSVDPKGVCRCNNVPMGGFPHVHTIEGHLNVSPNDWIITGVKGERYPCKPDIFRICYELEGKP